MDALVIENCILLKEDQPQLSPDQAREYLAKFQLD